MLSTQRGKYRGNCAAWGAPRSREVGYGALVRRGRVGKGLEVFHHYHLVACCGRKGPSAAAGAGADDAAAAAGEDGGGRGGSLAEGWTGDALQQHGRGGGGGEDGHLCAGSKE